MQIKMVMDVRSDLPFLSTPGTILRFGKIYDASANKHCTNDDSCIPCWLEWLKGEVENG